jgi:hypothetical protein
MRPQEKREVKEAWLWHSKYFSLIWGEKFLKGYTVLG